MNIRKSVNNELIAHAQKDSPIEACGYLAQKDGIVELSIPLKNVDAAAEHFSLDPYEQFDAVRKIRSLGMKLLGVYHSHPASPARPSQEDIRLLVDPNLSYVIVSLLDGISIKSFRIRSGSVEEEKINIVDLE